MQQSNSNKSIERVFLLISFNTNLNTLFLGNNIIADTNKKLEEYIGSLRRILNTSIPKIKIKESTFYGNTKDCRIIVVSDPNDIPDVFNYNEQSHIIIALYKDTKVVNEVWKSDPNEKADAIFNFHTAKELENIIIEISLDVVMSHYYRINANNVAEGKKLSKEKVQFKNQSQKLSYISLATFHRSEIGYNFDSYCDDWKKFYVHFMEHSLYNTNDNHSNNSVKNIFASHPQFGQLSMRKLSLLISDLAPGKYLLIRATKKPRKKQKQKKVLNQLGCKYWKTGFLKVCNIEQYYNFNRYNKYLTIYSFTIN